MDSARKPDLDHLITVPELLDFHYEHNPTRPVYVFAQDGRTTKISYLEFVRACHRLAHILRPGRMGSERAVIAVVALVDTLVYETIIAGSMKAGLVPLLISPRNSTAALVNLLKKTGAHRLLTTHSTLNLGSVKAELESGETNFEITFEECPSLHDLYPFLGSETASDPFDRYPSSPATGPHETAMYLHSSGSTGFPKAVPLSNLGVQSWGAFPSSTDLRDHSVPIQIGAMALPPFHAYAFYAQFACALFDSMTVALFPPVVTEPGAQPIMPTPENTLLHLQQTKSNCLAVVPTMLQSWSRSSSDISILRSLEVVIFAGGSLPPATGDYLVSEGVHIRSVYGGSEFAIPTAVDMADDRANWQWHRFSEKAHVIWAPQGDGTFECQFLVTDTHALSAENMQNARGYATSDLFMPHPTKKGLWKVVGRIDDVIVHLNSEKTVPAPLENVIMRSSLIQGAVMFGHERDQPGILIEPAPGNEVDVDDLEQVSSYRNKIWPFIEEANHVAPSFSRIYKEMILIASPTKPLPRAAKGTVMRKAAISHYEQEIAQIYEAVESTSNSSSAPPPISWNFPELQRWLINQASDICGANLTPTMDLFENGLDSLGATILRLRIVSALKNTKKPPVSNIIMQNTIYNHPSIQSLTEHIVALIGPEGSVQSETVVIDEHVRVMEAMIEKYSEGLETALDSPSANNEDTKVVVLLTGSTGNLGSQILSLLLRNRSVHRVYTVNRPSSHTSLLDRHKERFSDRGLDISLLHTDKLICLEGQSTLPKMGLSDEAYGELKTHVTVIIHNAWRLDFNLSLPSFETHVRGLRNLIDLARSSRCASSLRFLFTSTIASAQSWDALEKGPYPECVITDASYAVGMGYGEGKYVSERILAKSGLHSTSFRIGQISGGAPNGAWATSDWFPMIVLASWELNMLPDAHGVISWIPMDAVAEAIIDVGLSSDRGLPPPPAINLVHPYPIPWSQMIRDVRRALVEVKQLDAAGDTLPLVPFRKWLEALEKRVSADSAEVGNRLPAAKIIDFLRGMAEADERIAQSPHNKDEAGVEAVGLTPLVTTNIQRISEKMRILTPIGVGDVDLWVRYWVGAGL